jgi:hypothetical protein
MVELGRLWIIFAGWFGLSAFAHVATGGHSRATGVSTFLSLASTVVSGAIKLFGPDKGGKGGGSDTSSSVISLIKGFFSGNTGSTANTGNGGGEPPRPNPNLQFPMPPPPPWGMYPPGSQWPNYVWPDPDNPNCIYVGTLELRVDQFGRQYWAHVQYPDRQWGPGVPRALPR